MTSTLDMDIMKGSNDGNELQACEPGMSLPDNLLDLDEELPEADACIGDAYECQCERCRAWRIDIAADREYDERKDEAA